MKPDPHELAIKEIKSRIVTEEEAKKQFKKWIISTASGGGFSDEVLKFWDEVIKATDELKL